ncbi:MmcQ/YjbR family DNA-binding protein [Cumulibacter soli]|uniref:MmcQ/YjbR family DNA-binding protein n=1 Tax=Cumulibacter soli TaxID=2546344 RepID=UPI00106891FB|nr:MmcQ/YjbR family DNA-binding protein [Cumulibacter soli]
MAHPPRFDENDPYLRELRSVALDLPAAEEKISHGHPVFYTKKIFAIFGAVVKGDHASDECAQSVVFLPDAIERDALVQDERFFVPGYYGPSGWLGLNFRVSEPDWQEVAELVEMSYRNTAIKTLVRQLDAMR